jgi:lipoprotein-anchoring transpeptidase ErfK/SrfK
LPEENHAMKSTRRHFLAILCCGVAALPLAAATSAAPSGFTAPETRSQSRIIIRTSERKLYYYRNNELSDTFVIAVGKQGRKWSGDTYVSRKVLRPKWAPPAIIRRDNPSLPALIGPGPGNPLGAAVLVLGDGTYGIHGTNKESSIGTDASYGCFRMRNRDILRLFSKVDIGTPVAVLP